jgi:hypothetical protein
MNGVPLGYKAYLVAIFNQHTDDSLTLESVDVYSEYPLTQMFGRRCNVQMLVTDSYGASYDEAAQNLAARVMTYPQYEWARASVEKSRSRVSGRIFAGRSSRTGGTRK